MIKLENLESKKTWLYRGAIALIFTLAIAFRVHYLGEKEGFHLDEVYSVVLSNYGDIGWTSIVPAGNYSGAELKETLLYTDPSLKEAIKDIGRLWQDNRDAPHTNFYYSLLRLSFVGLEYRSVDGIVERAGTLNLIIFSITFFLFLSLLGKIFSDKRVILLALFVAFINIGEVSSTLFFRPYMLQSLFFVLATSIIITINEKIKYGEYKTTWQNLVCFSVILGLLLLTGYYAFVFAFLLGVTLLFNLYRYKQLDKIPFFISSIIIAVSLDFLLYPKFYQFVTHPHATEMLHNSGSSNIFSVVWRFVYMLILMVKSQFPMYIAMIVVIMTAMIGFDRKTKFVRLRKYMRYLFVAAVFSIVILFFAMYKDFRYISPAFALLTIFIPLLFDGIKRGVVRDILMVVLCVTIIVPLCNEKYISYLYKSRSIVSENVQLPVYVYHEKNYTLLSQVTFYDDEQRFVVCSSLDDMKLRVKHKDCFAIQGYTIGAEFIVPDWKDNIIVNDRSFCNIYRFNDSE